MPASSLVTASLNADDFNTAEFGCGKSILTVMSSSVGTVSISDGSDLVGIYVRVRLDSVSVLQLEGMTALWYISERGSKEPDLLGGQQE